MAPACTESASELQSHWLLPPASTGTWGSAALMAAEAGVAQACNCAGGTLGTAPMSAYQTWALPRPAATVLTQGIDRKSTRLNSSHSQISYAVFCLKKKKTRGAIRT